MNLTYLAAMILAGLAIILFVDIVWNHENDKFTDRDRNR